IMIYNDFKPELRSLIHSLTERGFSIIGGNNGEEPFDYSIPGFLDELTACDESDLFIEKNNHRFTLVLIFGNSPGELVADYHFSRAAQYSSALADLDAVLDAHYAKWEGRKQPTRTI